MAPAPPTATEFVTSEEVVDALQSDPFLRQLAVSCVLPAVRVGDEWQFRRTDLEAWIARQRNNSP
jgi:excisionase family DNA binding protein